jgi:hypothetical protein
METGTQSGIGRSWFAGIVLAGAAGCAAAQAQDVVAQAAAASPPPDTQPRLELSASSLPNFDSAAPAGPRLDLIVLPPRRSVGLAVGLNNLFAKPGTAANGFAAAPPPSMDVGVHWRHTLDNNQRVDVSAWRRVASQPDAYTLIQQTQPSYGAKVEFNLSKHAAPKTGLVAEKGFIGVRLDSGARITIKRRNGGPMVYYRTTF